jgi:hypothetical protein
MYNLTVKTIKDACRANKYIALRFQNGEVMGVNCMMAFLERFKNEPPEKITIFQSYNPISFSEYIRVKHGYYSRGRKSNN